MPMARLSACLGLAVLLAATSAWGQAARSIVSFNADWRFSPGDITGAQAPAFADGQWRTLDVPHDWSIEGEISQQNPTGPGGGFLPAGVGWYRKTFPLPANSAGKRVFIEFDGVMSDSTVWINGQELGRRPNGYMSFRYDLTGKLNPTGNVLAVRADNALQPASRWYTGAGINRHVRLIITDPVHLEQWATFVTTPRVAADGATVKVETSVINQGQAAREVGLEIEILGPDGRSTGRVAVPAASLAAGASKSFTAELPVANPQLWEIDRPAMYTAVTRVRSGDTTLDDESVRFGIRSFEFKGDTGFWLNGRNVRIYGACLHHDGGGVGAAVPMGVWERRLDALRALGVNGIRTAHNPPDPAFLDLCDREGFVVMHELFDCWMTGKNRGDYGRFFNDWWKIDLADSVKRDRNHPSIILYSTGNEIRDIPRTQVALPLLKEMRDLYKLHDPTRPITHALFRPNESNAYTNGIADLLDVVGTNYRHAELLAFHRTRPNVPIIGTEDNYALGELVAMRDNPQLSGIFMWTGVDYLGEAQFWPRIAQGFGMVNRINDTRARGFERQAWWTVKPMVRIARSQAPLPGRGAAAGGRGGAGGDVGGGRTMDWTPPNLAPHNETVEVYSNAETVELFLNDQSLGSRTWAAGGQPRSWQVAFAPGTLRAVARNGNQIVATDELRTAGEAVKLIASVDQTTLTPAWDDVAYVKVKVTDAQGVVNPTRMDLVTFTLTGPGIIMAVDNADLTSHERFRGNQRSAYMGTCVAVIKATAGTGQITVKASAEGLADSTVTIDARPAPPARP